MVTFWPRARARTLKQRGGGGRGRCYNRDNINMELCWAPQQHLLSCFWTERERPRPPWSQSCCLSWPKIFSTAAALAGWPGRCCVRVVELITSPTPAVWAATAAAPVLPHAADPTSEAAEGSSASKSTVCLGRWRRCGRNAEEVRRWKLTWWRGSQWTSAATNQQQRPRLLSQGGFRKSAEEGSAAAADVAWTRQTRRPRRRGAQNRIVEFGLGARSRVAYSWRW